MRAPYVLSNYPLSSDYRRRLEERLGAAPTYASLSELRRVAAGSMLARLRSVDAESVILAVEDENGMALLPVLQILAAITPARHKQVAMPGLAIQDLSLWSAARALATLGGASVSAVGTLVSQACEARSMLAQHRTKPQPQGSRRVLYLNANLWFGVKAGGSVGHIAGVANALLDRGYAVDLATAGGRQLVRKEAELVSLVPPAFSVPFETNYYRFARAVVEQLAPLASQRPYAFLYQRMSLANDSGVRLSRRFGLPLVLEYNSSEAWVAKHWGRPLKFDDLACRTEEACLKHAHLVVTVSEALRRELLDRGVEDERIVMYPNCIDPALFDPAKLEAERRSVRQRHGFADDETVVTFIGTFGQWHGGDVLARCVRKLAANHNGFLARRKVRFLLVGDGPRLGEVREILRAGDCDRLCTLTGLVPQQQAPGYLAAADVVLSPHVANEDGTPFFGSPTKLFEYMAMGKAIVASDLDQIGQVLKNSVRIADAPAVSPTGEESRLAVLVRSGDVDALAAGIEFCVERPEWRERLGRNARAEALARYTWGHHVGAILDRLRRLGLLGEA